MHNKKAIKRELLQYFEDIDDIRDIETCKFFLSYSNQSFLKILGLPKVIYRKYALNLNYGSIKLKITISNQNKETIKSLLRELYNGE